jgi:hypothetical protein
VVWVVGLERIVLEVNCVEVCGCGTDFVGW